jgi:hypothetical protein
MIEDHANLAELQVVDERFDGLASVAAQETFLHAVISWASDLARAGDAAPRIPLHAAPPRGS